MKPILFSTPMVQAILDGRKTMTRKVIKESTIKHIWNVGNFILSADGKVMSSDLIVEQYSKYKVGDVLYVREAWGLRYFGTSQYWHYKSNIPFNKDDIVYRASCGDEYSHNGLDSYFLVDKIWKPSIHMPKEHARIFLRVTNVRVERLQDISEDDCLKEGMPIEEKGLDVFLLWWMPLWNSTAKEGYKWKDDPYVFVYEFERVEKPC